MDEYRIKSRKDLRWYKSNVLKEIKSSGKGLKTALISDFSPQIKTPTGTRINYGKIIDYALIAYKGFVWSKKLRSFFKSNKKRRR